MRVFMVGAVAVTALACASRQAPAPVATLPASTPAEVTYYAPAGSRPAAVVYPSGAAPRYPDNLRRASIEGEVHATWVIDTTGRVLDGSFRVTSTTDTLFAAAVRATLPAMRYTPASLNGRPVRQLVQQSVYFDMVNGVAASRRPKPPRVVATADPSVRTPMPLGAIIVTAVASTGR